MEPDFRDVRPVSQQIAADLRFQIMFGEIVDTLPSFSSLASTYDASVNACQNAVKILKGEGLVTGQQGKALHVHRPQITEIPADAYLEPARGKVRYGRVSVERTPPPGDVAVVLRLSKGEPAVTRKMVMLINGEPAELIRNYYPPSIADGTALAEDAPLIGGAHPVLVAMGLPLRRMVDLVTDGDPTRDEIGHLRLPGYASVLRTLRAIYSDGDRPVEASILTKGGHRSAMRYSIDLH